MKHPGFHILISRFFVDDVESYLDRLSRIVEDQRAASALDLEAVHLAERHQRRVGPGIEVFGEVLGRDLADIPGFVP